METLFEGCVGVVTLGRRRKARHTHARSRHVYHKHHPDAPSTIHPYVRWSVHVEQARVYSGHACAEWQHGNAA